MAGVSTGGGRSNRPPASAYYQESGNGLDDLVQAVAAGVCAFATGYGVVWTLLNGWPGVITAVLGGAFCGSGVFAGVKVHRQLSHTHSVTTVSDAQMVYAKATMLAAQGAVMQAMQSQRQQGGAQQLPGLNLCFVDPQGDMSRVSLGDGVDIDGKDLAGLVQTARNIASQQALPAPVERPVKRKGLIAGIMGWLFEEPKPTPEPRVIDVSLVPSVKEEEREAPPNPSPEPLPPPASVMRGLMACERATTEDLLRWVDFSFGQCKGSLLESRLCAKGKEGALTHEDWYALLANLRRLELVQIDRSVKEPKETPYKWRSGVGQNEAKNAIAGADE